MGAEYTHAVTVNSRTVVNAGPVALAAGVPVTVQNWVANGRALQQLTFRVYVDNTGANPITAVGLSGANAAGGPDYTDLNIVPILPGTRAWFEAPGPPPEFWRLIVTSLLGSTCAIGYEETFIVAQ